MAPGRKRGEKGSNTKTELSLGDLVLAKVKGFPAWPAKISRPENLDQTHDPKKYFVNFFGTKEIAFVAPADIQAFTSESKDKLSVRCQGKTVRYFTQAVKEICEEFEELKCRNLSGVHDDTTQNLASQTSSIDPVVDEISEINGSNEIERKGTNCKLEFKGLTDLGSGLNNCSQRQGAMKSQDINHCSSNDICHNLSPYVSPVKMNKISTDPTNSVKKSVSFCSPANNFHPKEEGCRDIKLEGRYLDSGQKKLTNGHQPKLTVRAKNNSQGAMPRNSLSAVSRKHTGEGMHRKSSSGGVKVSSTDNLRPGLDVGNQNKDKELLKEKFFSEAVHGPQADAELYFEKHTNFLSKKEMTQSGSGKQTSETTEASCLTKLSKCADTGEYAGMFRAQMSRNNNSRSLDILNDIMTNIEPNRLISVGKAENCWNFGVQTTTNKSNCSTNEYDFPPTKRHRLAMEAMAKSAIISENKLGSSLSCKNDLVHPNKLRSPVMQMPSKRRVILRCDDNNDDELPKTPVHAKKTNKVSTVPHVSNSKKNVIAHDKDDVSVKLVKRNSAAVDDCLKEQLQSARIPNTASLPTPQQSMEKRPREFSVVHAFPSLPQLDFVKLISKEIEPVPVATKPIIELRNNHSCKALGIVSEKKAPAGPEAKRGFASASERSTSSQHQSISEISKPASSGEKMKSSPKSDSQTTPTGHEVGIADENIAALGQRVDVVKVKKISSPIDSKNLDTVMSMKHLIAAAQARKRKPHILNSYGNHFPLLIHDADMSGQSPSPSPAKLEFESRKTFQIDIQESHSASPNSVVLQLETSNQSENEELEERRVSSGNQVTECSLIGGTEIFVARDAFKEMIETLARTKESIGRATRHAIDCAKYGIANEVVELLIKKLENESCFDRRVDLFFLVDSITQSSHSKKGIAGASYLPIIQVALPRIIGAVAPYGVGAKENRRQCHKVLRLWLERKILPDYVLRRYMDAISAANDDTSAGFSLRRPSRADRAIDDPIRGMEGFFLDEYGSNATFQLPGLLTSHIFEEEDDEDTYTTNLCNEVADASPSKHTPAASRDKEDYTVITSKRRPCILEEVECELEMEDVSGHQDDPSSFINGSFEPEPISDGIFESVLNIHTELLSSPEGSPPLPLGSPPLTPPLPTSPPPLLLPPPQLSSQQHLFSQPPTVSPPPYCPLPPPSCPPLPDCPPSPASPPLPVSSPLLFSLELLSHQPALISEPMSPSLPFTMATSPASPNEIGDPTRGKKHALLVPNAQRSHFNAYVRSEVLSNQSSCFPPARVSNVRNQNGYSLSRPAEYVQGDAQALRRRQPLLPGGIPVTRRPLYLEPLPRHFSNQNSFYQHQHPPYSLPKISEDPRRNATDEQWRMQVNESYADCPRGGRMAGYRFDGTRKRYNN